MAMNERHALAMQEPAIQTRLDKAIRRLKAQRLVLDWAAAELGAIAGIVLELGLGNGRSYGHLRNRLPEREIFVFERQGQVHPDTVPPERYLILGKLEDTLPAVQVRFAGK